jgi:hypothetical protein
MQKSFWFTIWGVALAGLCFGQIKKQFTVENTQACENIKLNLRANSGNCYIKPSQNPEILNVFSNQDESTYSHSYRKETRGKTCEVYLNLEEVYAEGIGQTISTKMFGNEKPTSDKIWKMYLTDSKPYLLELNYAVGNAHVDLSGLAVKKLKINTGSADVHVGYNSLGNQVDMDTFAIKVDLGSLNAKNLNLSRTKYMVADVGFGNMLLDFSSGTPLVANNIRGSVGAGNLVIILPSEETPVYVKIKDSWLCSVKMPAGLNKVAENTYQSKSYTKNAKNALVFDLDVSMGHIVFKEASK